MRVREMRLTQSANIHINSYKQVFFIGKMFLNDFMFFEVTP